MRGHMTSHSTRRRGGGPRGRDPMQGGPSMRRRVGRVSSLCLAMVCGALLSAPGASAAIEPPWCGTPEPDVVGSLPDGSSPTDPVGSFPHIPYYAIGCTLERI